MLLVLLLLGLGWVRPLSERNFFLWFMHTSLFEFGKFCKVEQKLTQTFKILWHILVLHL